jgi:hypothetical protein
MRVVPEQVLLGLLDRCLKLSQEVLPLLPDRGSQPVPDELSLRFQEVLGDLHREKRHDSVLNDESWEWIWDRPPRMNHLQLYGRLAWLNYTLFDLL